MVRDLLRSSKAWIKFQEARREGFGQAYRRARIQKKILESSPIRTASAGPREVRVLTWRRGWLDALWALKSFYRFSGVDYPLYIHDGGLEPDQYGKLLEHFPNARIVPWNDARDRVEKILKTRGFTKSLEYRRQNVATLKVFDFFLLSQAETIISIDSDIVFFKSPDLLIGNYKNCLYNKDMQYAYSMKVEDLEKDFGIKPIPYINSGLSLVGRDVLRFDLIESWLKNEKLFGDKWVTEQTLHALSATLHGVELLPETYAVSTEPGLNSDLVCKHYPGFFRPHLYNEGMQHLLQSGFLGRTS